MAEEKKPVVKESPDEEEPILIDMYGDPDWLHEVREKKKKEEK